MIPSRSSIVATLRTGALALVALLPLLLPATALGQSARFPTMFLRGTMNDWGASPMMLVADHTWEIVIPLHGDTHYQFKFEVGGGSNWIANWGDNDLDGYGDANGRNIDFAAHGGGDYLFRFNDKTHRYVVTRLHHPGPEHHHRHWDD